MGEIILFCGKFDCGAARQNVDFFPQQIPAEKKSPENGKKSARVGYNPIL